MSMLPPLCLFCKRKGRSVRDRKTDKWLEYCEAYPNGDGIPEAVYWTGHFKPKPGDNGLQFVPKDDVDRATIRDMRRECANEDENYKNYEPLPEGVDA